MTSMKEIFEHRIATLKDESKELDFRDLRICICELYEVFLELNDVLDKLTESNAVRNEKYVKIFEGKKEQSQDIEGYFS